MAMTSCTGRELDFAQLVLAQNKLGILDSGEEGGVLSQIRQCPGTGADVCSIFVLFGVFL